MQFFGDVGHNAEFDTISCAHCNKIVRVKPGTGATVYIFEQMLVDPVTRQYRIIVKEEAGAFCRCCMKPVCLPCDEVGTCTPLMKKIEEQERQGRMLKTLEL